MTTYGTAMVRSWIALGICVILLAGCFGGDTGTHDEEPHDQAHDHAPHGNDEGHADAPLNLTFTADLHNGTVPLQVQFAWNLTGGDPDALSFWELDAGAADATNRTGEGREGNVSHVYETPGLFTAALTYTVGNDTLQEVLQISVEGVVDEGRPIVAVYEETATVGTYALQGSPQTALQCPGFITGNNGDGCAMMEFEADHDGLPYLAAASEGNLRMAFWGSCSPTSSGVGWAASTESTHEDTVPEGAGCLVIWSSGQAGSEITYTFTVYAA